jgi:hypothetical protein
MVPLELKITDHKNVYIMQFEDCELPRDYSCLVESAPHLVTHWSPENPYSTLADSSQIDSLNQCILLFHQARESMMQEAAPAKVTLPGGESGVLCKKRFSPERLTLQASPVEITFLVNFDCEGNTIQYRFNIKEDGPIVGLQWEHQFWLDMGGELELAHPLLKSILSFYELCRP